MKLPRLPGGKAAKRQAASAPTPVTSLSRAILASVAMRVGGIFLKRGVDRGILGIAPQTVRKAAHRVGLAVAEPPEEKPAVSPAAKADGEGAAKSAAQTIAAVTTAAAGIAARTGSGIGARLLTTAATRIATRSVPGAIIVGGALLAKTLHERRKNRHRPKRP